jgi:hypothetical protein
MMIYDGLINIDKCGLMMILWRKALKNMIQAHKKG